MKHGDKTKKSAKGKTTGKKAGRKVAPPPKAQSRGSKVSKTSSKAAPAKISSSSKSGNGKTVPRSSPGVVNFSNPIVAAAFKRAVKKYPTAFRRLTD